MKLLLTNSHQNSHSLKIKMATVLAASHLVDFIMLLAPQVGLEPTTLRLTAECSVIHGFMQLSTPKTTPLHFRET
jgi:hypothetical protein